MTMCLCAHIFSVALHLLKSVSFLSCDLFLKLLKMLTVAVQLFQSIENWLKKMSPDYAKSSARSQSLDPKPVFDIFGPHFPLDMKYYLRPP